ncbi:hypothetical protein AB0N09_30700 [Streptomyces erythrochromogenes]|uniref:hypothetical protein n=1 Tax=Streptomyces erythrochromogenes TaxID=285574 RepID=UPI003427C135
MSASSMRAVVITESLTTPTLPDAFTGLPERRYPHDLDGQTPIEIIEVSVPADQAAARALDLARALKATLFYAHLIDDERMLIAFPDIVVTVERGDDAAIAHARAVGALFDIPDEQMRFAEMWDTDHPDAPEGTEDGA